MTRRHKDVLDDVLKGFDAAPGRAEAPAANRYVRRAMGLAETAAGVRQEKTLLLVDPADCVMWARHNREYARLTRENCADVIDSMISQGRQEFPAIVRRRAGAGEGQPPYEVICGARRHFAVSWLRANNYPQFRYLIEVRDLTDEEAFRLSDIENRGRADISDLERARDYAEAIGLYYGGRQKDMAARLEVSEGWLSRYLALARIPAEIVAAFADPAEVKERHARALKPGLDRPETRPRMLAEAGRIVAEQAAAMAGQGETVPAHQVMARLLAAARPTRPPRRTSEQVYRGPGDGEGIHMKRRGTRVVLEFERGLSEAALRAALEAYLTDHREILAHGQEP